MNLKLLVSAGLVLGLVSEGSAKAQPAGGHTYRSLQARILEVPAVFRGTITNVVETLTGASNDPSHNYSVALRVDEVLKGSLPIKPIRFDIKGVAEWNDLKKGADQHIAFLWFASDSLDSLGYDFFGLVNFIYLGPEVAGIRDKGVFDNFQEVYDMDMTLLTRPEDILDRARAFAKQRVETARFYQICLPWRGSDNLLGFRCCVSVPVEPSLERTAKRLIIAPRDFIPDPGTHGPDRLLQWQCRLRASGVSALQYFKSDANMKLLKSLLNATDFWSFEDATVSYKAYPVRSAAYQVLTDWGVAVSQPVASEQSPRK